ncbi:Multidrug-efflux transporter [Desulfurella amilsii]|uniref:Multidrug-efflux transporter n=2 Tax=Desulfurella amilsii TaxID=1562698 RepID=A0A1X4Y042_9BACT|nr:Multidrug-efflux transporter [Desulfurella amilsii]
MGYNGFQIGLVYTFVSLFGAFGSLFVGIISDKTKRKPFLVIYTVLLMIASLGMLFATDIYAIAIFSAFGSFGLGANGAAGPFSPAEQALLAENIKPNTRGAIFSLNTALGFLGMSIGSAFAMVFSFLKFKQNNLEYQLPYIIIFVFAILTLVLLLEVKENYRSKVAKSSLSNTQEQSVNKKENFNLLKLIGLNSINGLAIGLKGPLIAYFFAVRFGVGAKHIGLIFAITFLLSAILSFYTGKLSLRVGIIKSVFIQRLIGLVFLILLPLAPSYIIASIFYIFHQIFNRSSAGARQALTVSLVRDKRRGFAVSINSASMQFPRSIGPYVAGILFDASLFAIPFFMAAFLQGLYLIFYKKFFKDFNFPTE